jgi:hypothetical protein
MDHRNNVYGEIKSELPICISEDKGNSNLRMRIDFVEPNILYICSSL